MAGSVPGRPPAARAATSQEADASNARSGRELSTLYDDVERGLLRDEGPAADAAAATAEWLDDARQLLTPLIARPLEARARVSPPPSLQAAILAARVRRRALADSDDVASLAATARGGAILERRAALERLAELAKHDAARLDAVDLRPVSHEPQLELDLLRLSARLRGAAGREARAELARVNQLLKAFETAVRQVVEGVRGGNPLAELDPHQRARLMLHARHLDDFSIGFIIDSISAAVTEGDTAQAVDSLAAVRPMADARLLMVLAGALLDDPRSEVRAEAARCIARVDDRRVVPLLVMANARASDLGERIALAEALGIWGDFRSSDAILEGLADPGRGTRIAALDALYDPALVERAVARANQEDFDERRAAIRALGRAGDERALGWLDRLEGDEAELPPALGVELSVAREAVLARAEMRGDAPHELLERARRGARKRTRALERSPGAPPTKRHRVLAWLLMLRALVLSALRLRESASALCDRALAADPRWYRPGLYQGRLWDRAGDLARAVAGYRRALAIAPAELSARAADMTRIATAYLNRAEALHDAGRIEVARAVLDELSVLDLSSVPPHIRHALRRRRRRLLLMPSLPSASGSPAR